MQVGEVFEISNPSMCGGVVKILEISRSSMVLHESQRSTSVTFVDACILACRAKQPEHPTPLARVLHADTAGKIRLKGHERIVRHGQQRGQVALGHAGLSVHSTIQHLRA